MRTQVLLPCLILLALCGLLVSQKNVAPKTTAVKAVASAGVPEAKFQMFPEKKLAISAVPSMAVAPVETAVGLEPDFSGPDEIISALNADDATVRTTAREAAVQTGNRDLIPALESVAARTADAREKAALLDAAEFIALPAISEALAVGAGR